MVKRAARRTVSKDVKRASSSTPPLIWQRLLTARESRKLDYLSIAREAMQLANEGGLDEVSMRNLAARLGAGTMSLYRYVLDKDDVWDLMLDETFGEISTPAKTSGDWKRDLKKVAVETRRVILSHPWLATLMTRRPTIGPNYLRWFEFLLAATAAPGRNIKTQVRMIGTLWSFVSGFVAYEIGASETNRRHDLTEERKREFVAPYMAQVLASGSFPHLAKFLDLKMQAPSEEDFVIGLEVMLDGLSRRVLKTP